MGFSRVRWFAIAASLLGAPGLAQAVLITVDTTEDEVTADEDCSIREAFRAANLNLPQDACPAGSNTETDEIVLPAGTYTLTRAEVEGAPQTGFSGDLDIVDNAAELDLIVRGAGADATILQTCPVDQQSAPCPAGQGITDVLIHNGFPAPSAEIHGLTMRHGGATAGAVFNQGALVIADCVLTANLNVAINSQPSGTLTLSDSEISDTIIQSGATLPGALFTQSPTNVIRRSSIVGNSGPSVAGIATRSPSAGQTVSLTIDSSTIAENHGGVSGAGLRLDTGTIAHLNNTTISGNTSNGSGAGISALGATVELSNCTVTDNRMMITTTANDGAGIRALSSTVTLRNTIVAGNFDDHGVPPVHDCFGTFVSAGHNLIGDGTGCQGFTDGTNGDQVGTLENPIFPALEELAANGGSTETHALLPGSPAVDAGNPAACTDSLGVPFAFDQTGGPRTADGDGDGTPRCDAGAFELGGTGVANHFALRPNAAGNGGRATVLFLGRNFVAGSEVKLARVGEADIVAEEIALSSDTSVIAARFDLTDRPLGVWDAFVVDPGGTVRSALGAFTIEAAGAPELWVDIVGPPTVRSGRPATFQVLYGNRGNAEALVVPLVIGLPRDFDYEARVEVVPPPPHPGLPAIDWSRVPIVMGSPQIPGVQAISLLLPAVLPGWTGTLELRITAPPSAIGRSDDLPVAIGDPWVHEGVADEDDVLALVEGARLYAWRVLDVGIPRSRIPEMTAIAAAQLEDLAQYDLAHVLAQGLKPSAVPHLLVGLAAAFGQAVDVEICDDEIDNDADDLIDLADPDCTRGSFAEGADSDDEEEDEEDEDEEEEEEEDEDEEECEPEEAESPWYADDDCDGEPDCMEGGFNTCAPKPCKKWPPTACGGPGPRKLDIVGSSDPNDKAGSVGAGEAHYLTGVDPIPYTIQFENKPEATAPAQEVVITDQLDPATMDLSTLSLGPIGFGDTTVVPPPGLRAYTTEVDLRPAQDLLVRVEASLDEATSVLTWRFTSLDPQTGELPEDPLAGFLPPNANPPEGQGSVLFTVDPVDGLPTGTEIRNEASIVFDVNEPIVTPEWVNTIDIDEPSSRVDSATTGECSQAIAVAWSGMDAGSGIQSYDVLVSEDGGPFTVWRNDTTSTSGTFRGKWGRTYGFASVARDGAGHVEDAPLAADVSATVPDCGPFDLAVTKIIVPKNLTLSQKKPVRTVLAKVQIQNRSAEPQTIASLGVLRELVSLEVVSLGACPAPQPILLSGKPQKARPITVKSKQKLNVVFELTFGCANDPSKSSGRDPGHEDYEVRAVVDQSVLGGEDAFPADDACPRIVAPPGVAVPYPDGKITDKGCGTKRPDRTFGDPVKVDVADKR